MILCNFSVDFRQFKTKKVFFTCPHDDLDYMSMLLMLCWRCMVAWEAWEP